MMVSNCDAPCAATTDPVAFVEEVERSVHAGRTVKLQGRPPVTVFAVRGAFDSDWEIVSVFLVLKREEGNGGPPRRWWAARRATFRNPEAARWADTNSCVALANSLGELKGVSTVQAPLAGNEVLSAPPKFVADGALVTLWSTDGRQAGDWPVQVTLSAFGGPLADWAGETLKATQNCWSPRQPEL